MTKHSPEIITFTQECVLLFQLQADQRKLTALTAHRNTAQQTIEILQKSIAQLQTEIDVKFDAIKILVDNVEDKETFITTLNSIPEMQSAHVDKFIYNLMPEEIKKMEDAGNDPITPLRTLKDFTKMGLENFKKCHPEQEISEYNDILFDRLTPCYRGTSGYYGAMSKLSKQQQLVFWHVTEQVLKNGAATTPEVTKATHLENTQISAVMQILKEKEFVIADKTQSRKTQYKIDDPFFLNWASISWFPRKKYAPVPVPADA